MTEYKQLILANMAWQVEKQQDDPEYFSRHAGPENPMFLWIGSSDSRVVPERITRSPPGSLYIHRNLGNLVSESDLNLMAAVEHALVDLKVRHIIVCGNYGCLTLGRALRGDADDVIDQWLAPAREVYDRHFEEIDAMPDPESRLSRFVECNVRDQLVRLARSAPVQSAFARGQDVKLHGWVYDLRDGLIKPLMEIDSSTDLDGVPRPERVLM
ncbi:carbonic anhydrase [Polymorphobacter sp.]|uniref:carbonic anhydrase n=1 Tax=Polymorphobacter sp. TaxID=1909290 RepID=UPI003F7284D6